jgi:hypothetical protein
MISMLKQAGFRVPDGELLERVGYGNPEVLASQWQDEQIENAALQNLLKMEQAKVDLQIQQAQMGMQMQQQQAMQQEQMAQQQMAQEQAMQQNVGGQGFNPAMGGEPPMEAQPGMTATQIPGERMV